MSAGERVFWRDSLQATRASRTATSTCKPVEETKYKYKHFIFRLFIIYEITALSTVSQKRPPERTRAIPSRRCCSSTHQLDSRHFLPIANTLHRAWRRHPQGGFPRHKIRRSRNNVIVGNGGSTVKFAVVRFPRGRGKDPLAERGHLQGPARAFEQLQVLGTAFHDGNAGLGPNDAAVLCHGLAGLVLGKAARDGARVGQGRLEDFSETFRVADGGAARNTANDGNVRCEGCAALLLIVSQGKLGDFFGQRFHVLGWWQEPQGTIVGIISARYVVQ